MATYPLTEARFQEIVKAIQANRLARHAQYHPEDAGTDVTGVAGTGESSASPGVGGAPGVRH